MGTLAFDLTTTPASLALDVGGARWVDRIVEQRDQGRLLIPRIDGLLQQANLSLDAVTTILTLRGPGSFTGIRVALASLLGFTVGQKAITAASYTVFDVLCYKAMQQTLPFPYITLVPAPQDNYFIQEWLDAETPLPPYQGLPPALDTHTVIRRFTEGAAPVAAVDIDVSAEDLLDVYHAWYRLAEACAQAATPLYVRQPDVTVRAP